MYARIAITEKNKVPLPFDRALLFLILQVN